MRRRNGQSLPLLADCVAPSGRSSGMVRTRSRSCVNRRHRQSRRNKKKVAPPKVASRKKKSSHPGPKLIARIRPEVNRHCGRVRREGPPLETRTAASTFNHQLDAIEVENVQAPHRAAQKTLPKFYRRKMFKAFFAIF